MPRLFLNSDQLFLTSSSQFIYWAWCSTVWLITLGGPGQLCWPCSLPASCVPAQQGKLKSLWFRVNSSWEKLKHQCVTKNCIPAGSRTSYVTMYRIQGEKWLMKGMKKVEVNETGLGGQHACGVPHKIHQCLWLKRNDRSQRIYKNLWSFISKLYTWHGNWSVSPLGHKHTAVSGFWVRSRMKEEGDIREREKERKIDR